MARKLESLLLDGPIGPLEALLEEPEDQAVVRAALVCHPHPLYGGTMHNKVVHRLARGLRRRGAGALRFNFRGVGKSEGTHAGGIGEIEDARAALDYLRRRYPGLPCTLAGFSFGSRVVLKLGCGLADPPEKLVAAGFPTRAGNADYLGRCPIPKLFIQSTQDQYGPRAEMEAMFAQFADPKRLVWIEAGDHFFSGALDQLEEAVYEAG